MKNPADEFVGRLVLGRYRIVGVLAHGGMGVIYLARSEGAAGFTRPFVVKRILSAMDDDHTIVSMFKREARIMSNLRHPGVVSVIDFGRDHNSYFMVLDYIHGFHLGRWLRFTNTVHGLFPLNFALHTIIHVLDALHYAHTLNGPDGKPLQIIHRDVTPSNVLIDVDGHVKLADFGIARMRTDTTDVGTAETQIKGKMSYLAPEILQGSAPTPVSDVYGAAVVLHEILLGRNVFRSAQMAVTASRVMSYEPEPLNQLRQDVSSDLAAVIDRALSKQPEQRFQTASEFANALRAMRPENAEVTQSKMSEAVFKDFFDPRMAQVLDADSLASLEHAWRDTTNVSTDAVQAAYTSSRPLPKHEDPPPLPMLVTPSLTTSRRGYKRTNPHRVVSHKGVDAPVGKPIKRNWVKDLVVYLRQKPLLLWTAIGFVVVTVLAMGGLVRGIIRLFQVPSGLP